MTCHTTTKKCVCLNGFYDIPTDNCIITTTTTTTTTATTALCNVGTCAAGWYFLRGTCYRSVVFYDSGGFEKLSVSDIAKACGRTGSTLALVSEFSLSDLTWLEFCICPTASTDLGTDGRIYFGSVSSVSCPIYNCPSSFGTHTCDHGSDPITNTHHALFCKYT